jgi:hypothetical protein
MSERERVQSVDLSGKDIEFLDLGAARVRNANFEGLRVDDSWMPATTINGMYSGLVVNGIAVAPHVFAEIRRLHPLLAELSPKTADGVRHGFDVVYGLWDALEARAAELDEEVLRQRVDDEWCFVETMRHLIYATDCWFVRVVLDDPEPFHQLARSHTPAHGSDPGIDVDADPSYADVLAARHARQSRVRTSLATLTDADLDSVCEPTTPGNPPGSHKLGDALRTILDEEYWHSTYATRDLDALTLQ